MGQYHDFLRALARISFRTRALWNFLHRKLSLFYLGRLAAIFRKINGYRFVVVCCAWTSGVVLLINLVVTLWAIGVSGTVDGLGVLYDGSCKISSRLGFWIHLLINILSSALLAASNYTMQCLASPTRAEIDIAHSKGTWLDIGIPSIRNLSSVAQYRQVLWWTLAISTLPLHLLWNSAFFVSLSGQIYTAWLVPSDFALFNPILPKNPTSLDPLSHLEVLGPESYNEALGNQYNYSSSRYRNGSYHTSNTSATSTTLRVEHNQVLVYSNCSSQVFDDHIGFPLNNNTANSSSHPKIVPFSQTIAGSSFLRGIMLDFQTNHSSFEKLNAVECLEKYSGPILSGRRTVFLVSLVNSSNSMWWPPCRFTQQASLLYPDSEYACSDDNFPINPFACTTHQKNKTVRNSFFDRHGIEYCWSRRTTEHCRVEYSSTIMAAVISCNFVKLICMIYIAWKPEPEPLLSIGDAITSFLEREDTTTRGACLVDEQLLINQSRPLPKAAFTPKANVGSKSRFHTRYPIKWRSARRFKFATVSGGRWKVCSSLQVFTFNVKVRLLIVSRYMTTLIASCSLLGLGLDNDKLPGRSLKDLYTLGLGTVTPNSVINSLRLQGTSGLIGIALVSNSPQLVLSFVYVSYNSLFTSMCLSREWNSYATHRKALRVTSAKREQRSTYWLQLPYRYSVPLFIAFAALHWLVSQSIFLAHITAFDKDDTESPAHSLVTCGYSVIGLVFILGAGSLLVLCPFVFGFRTFDTNIPLARSCSAAISAACHQPEADADAAFKPIQWGEVRNYELNNSNGDQDVGHCCFTSLSVTRPTEGRVYA